MGTERGPCYPNSTCNEGLACLSEICVAYSASTKDAGTPDLRSLPQLDAGAPPDANPRSTYDSGAHPDSGIPPSDSGIPPADSGVPPYDSGAGTVTDAGTPIDMGFIDSGLPPHDAGRPAGLGDPCTSNRDCNTGLVCGEIVVRNNVVGSFCRVPNPAPAGAVGTACNTDIECQGNLCLGGVTNECSIVCADATLDCPAGYDCVGHTYNPGNATIGHCQRGCARSSDCPTNMICTAQPYQNGASWQISNICSSPIGAGDVGAPCSDPGDCQTGLCLTTWNYNGCTSNAGCDADENCECQNGSAPPCSGGGAAACISNSCSAVCTSAADCQASSYPQNQLTACNSQVTFTLPDGSQTQVLTCTRD